MDGMELRCGMEEMPNILMVVIPHLTNHLYLSTISYMYCDYYHRKWDHLTYHPQCKKETTVVHSLWLFL